MEENQNPQQEIIPAAPLSIAEKSRPPTDLYPYEDSNYYYLYKDAAHRAVRRLCEEQGESFSISAVALTKALAEEGFSVRDGSKNTKKLDLGSTSPRMIWLRKDRAQKILDEVC